jgi:hypothetical protein
MAYDSLVVLWTSGDKEVATKMVFMYTVNAKKKNWWNAVTLIAWGPSAKLLTEDPELQKKISALEDLGIEVKYMGGPLTNYIKGEHHILTF